MLLDNPQPSLLFPQLTSFFNEVCRCDSNVDVVRQRRDHTHPSVKSVGTSGEVTFLIDIHLKCHFIKYKMTGKKSWFSSWQTSSCMTEAHKHMYYSSSSVPLHICKWILKRQVCLTSCLYGWTCLMKRERGSIFFKFSSLYWLIFALKVGEINKHITFHPTRCLKHSWSFFYIPGIYNWHHQFPLCLCWCL